MFDAAVAFKCFGVATGYLITVGDCMVDATTYMLPYGSTSILTHRQFWVLLGGGCVASLSFFRTLDALKYTSAVSVVFVLAMTLVILLYAAGADGLDPCEDFKPSEGEGGKVGDMEERRWRNMKQR